MQPHERLVLLAFVPVQLAALERLRIVRRRDAGLHRVGRQARKLLDEFPAALLNCNRHLRIVIGEIQKRRRRAEFLTLEQHRCAGQQQQQRRQRPIAPRRRLKADARAVAGVGDLVVILEIDDERTRRHAICPCATRLLLPRIPLALE